MKSDHTQTTDTDSTATLSEDGPALFVEDGGEPGHRPFEPETGTQLGGGFIVERPLGRGERSTVMLVRRTETGEAAAFKVVDAGPWRFERDREGPLPVPETPETQDENQYGVLRVFDRRLVRRQGRRLVFELSEWADGGSLPDHLETRDLPTTQRRDEALTHGRNCVRGLMTLQTAGYVLADLQWSDLLLVDGRLKVSVPSPALIAARSEHTSGGRSLVQRVGVLLHVLFHSRGELPEACSTTGAHQSYQVADELDSDLPSHETRLLEKALAPDDQEHFQTLGALLEELDHAYALRQAEPDEQTLDFWRSAADAYLHGRSREAHKLLDQALRNGWNHSLISSLHERLQNQSRQVEQMLESMTDASLRRRVQLLREAADIYPDHPKLESAIEQLNQLLGQIREEMDEATRLWSSGRIEQAIVCLQSIQRRAAGDTQLQRAEHRVRKYQQWLEQQLSRLERAIEEQAWGEALDVARQVVTIGAKRKDTDDDPATTPE